MEVVEEEEEEAAALGTWRAEGLVANAILAVTRAVASDVR